MYRPKNFTSLSKRVVNHPDAFPIKKIAVTYKIFRESKGNAEEKCSSKFFMFVNGYFEVCSSLHPHFTRSKDDHRRFTRHLTFTKTATMVIVKSQLVARCFSTQSL